LDQRRQFHRPLSPLRTRRSVPPFCVRLQMLVLLQATQALPRLRDWNLCALLQIGILCRNRWVAVDQRRYNHLHRQRNGQRTVSPRFSIRGMVNRKQGAQCQKHRRLNIPFVPWSAEDASPSEQGLRSLSPCAGLSCTAVPPPCMEFQDATNQASDQWGQLLSSTGHSYEWPQAMKREKHDIQGNLTFRLRVVLKFGDGCLVSGAVYGRHNSAGHTSWPHTTYDG
jgi:hypothetical protein